MKRLIYRITKKIVRSLGKDISYIDLKEMIKENRNIVIIDVRTKDEFQEFHLDGAVNVPLQDIERNIMRYVKSKSDVVVVYCQYGGRSRKAFKKLEKMGFVNVHNLDGGIEEI